MGVPKTIHHIQINIRMRNPSQEPPASSKAPYQALKVMEVICIFKIKIESQIQNMGVLKFNDHFQIEIKMPNSIQEPPVCSKSPCQDFKDMNVLCTSKIKIEPKFGIWVYQRPVTISKSISGRQTPVRNLQHPPKPQMRT